MKNKLIIAGSILLLFVFFYVISPSLTLAAESDSSDVSINITTNKDKYSNNDDVIVNVKVTNLSQSQLSNLSIENNIPDGLKLKNSEQIATISGKNVKNGDSIDMQFVLVKDYGTTSLHTKGPKTEDNNYIWLYVIMMFFACVAIICLKCNRKLQNKIISFMLVFVILMVNSETIIFAAEQTTYSLEKKITITMGNESYVMASSVKYEKNNDTNDVDNENNNLDDSNSFIENDNINGENHDSDNDGLIDIVEDYYLTDKNNPDTDADGLSDFVELKYTYTDPTSKQSDGTVDDSDRDEDNDNLNNISEIGAGTDPLNPDTDGDGLSDDIEINTYHTSPVNADTDSDGIDDKWEIDNDYNPLVANSTFEVSKSIESDDVNVSVDIELKGQQIGSLSITPVSDNILDDSIPGYIGCAYDFSVIGEFESATLQFEFDDELLEDSTFVPAIYYYNEEQGILEELDTTVTGNVATATITHFSKYILLNKTKVSEVWDSDISIQYPQEDSEFMNIAFVVDTSASMEGDNINTVKEILRDFVTFLDNDDKVALVTFNEVASVSLDFTTNREELDYYIGLLDGRGGTVAFEGISEANKLFVNDTSANSKDVMILLSDGVDQFYVEDYNQYYQEYYAHHVDNAKQNDVTIYTIGLGEVNDAILKPVAENTNGKYYYAESIDELSEQFDYIKGEVIVDGDDSNNDGISDYYTQLMCDGELFFGTGKKVFGDLSYDEVQANNDWDGDGLKNGEEVQVLKALNTDIIYIKMISDPLLIDTDNDGYEDNEDLAPLVEYKKPVVLIHGRGDNTVNTYGAGTYIQNGDNNHYNSNSSLDGNLYTSADSHRIININDGKLAKKLIEDYGYKINDNMFAFNYPNQDFNQHNASKLKSFIDDLLSKAYKNEGFTKSAVFATEEDANNLNVEFILVGHSNGGLVSRYYIENLSGKNYVDRLITIDTPHYGSGIAYASGIIDIADAVSDCYPLDVELKPGSTLYGGTKGTFVSFADSDRANYINNNQSPALKGNKGATKYYAVGGYDVQCNSELTQSIIKAEISNPSDVQLLGEMGKISSELRNKVFGFEFNRLTTTKTDFNSSINAALNQFSMNASGKKSELNLGDSDGDNVVDTFSQFGVNFNNKNGLESYVDFEKTAIVIDTITGHNMINHFHSATLKENVTLSFVCDYLE